MQQGAIAPWRLLRAVAHLLHGMALMTRFPRLDAAARHETIRVWSTGLLQRLGIAIEVVGTPATGATLVVANHVSWLDIATIHAVLPQARFVSKADVLRWPLLGWLIRGAGTLFIERDRKRDALRVVHAVAAALAAGDMVAVFPEGTTGDGPELLPFHANLLQAAIATATPVQPVVLRFDDAQQRCSPAAAYVGKTTLLQSVWRVAAARGLRVRVELMAPRASAGLERRALAQQLREQMSARLGL
ncbi:MAG: 1-acyl-sn-glycerol-3-phosphate acyltransferase [Burkholderiales bacterium]|nr:1-acyl-sn-glycerol-3-phosphate acyltransferase [Burkholderiales bacterium]